VRSVGCGVRSVHCCSPRDSIL